MLNFLVSISFLLLIATVFQGFSSPNDKMLIEFTKITIGVSAIVALAEIRDHLKTIARK